ncbi:hypothetical protein HD806DRAFT_541538 [Xylariaceae sp. AK1471]|nr:hypothetical protein HD806DRAFT_541538 [Xylariaceae sp. AK1471]
MDPINQRLGIGWTFRIIGIAMLVTGLPMVFLIKDRYGLPPVREWVEWSLFKGRRFTTLFLCGLVASFPLFVPVFFIPHDAPALTLLQHIRAYDIHLDMLAKSIRLWDYIAPPSCFYYMLSVRVTDT